MMYRLCRPLLFALPAEFAHNLALKYIKYIYSPICRHFPPEMQAPRKVLGLDFVNCIGLAAGFDKNADYIDALFNLGFGFIEVGGVTPLPQYGNPKPRLYRLPRVNALINRMGFNNLGVDHLVQQLKKRTSSGIVGVNIGKNKETALVNACDDYVTCLTKVYPVADYVSINISSPNTPGLRQLQSAGYLQELVCTLDKKRVELSILHGKRVPLVVKTSIDLPKDELFKLVDILLTHNIDGIIVSNTSIDHSAVSSIKHGKQAGGLSGSPLAKSSNQMIAMINNYTQHTLPIIGVGGILSGNDALDKIDCGASLVQIYSGLIYQGIHLIKEAITATAEHGYNL